MARIFTPLQPKPDASYCPFETHGPQIFGGNGDLYRADGLGFRDQGLGFGVYGLPLMGNSNGKAYGK